MKRILEPVGLIVLLSLFFALLASGVNDNPNQREVEIIIVRTSNLNTVWITNYVDVTVYTMIEEHDPKGERVLKAALSGGDLGWRWRDQGFSREAVSNSIVQSWQYLNRK